MSDIVTRLRAENHQLREGNGMVEAQLAEAVDALAQARAEIKLWEQAPDQHLSYQGGPHPCCKCETCTRAYTAEGRLAEAVAALRPFAAWIDLQTVPTKMPGHPDWVIAAEVVARYDRDNPVTPDPIEEL